MDADSAVAKLTSSASPLRRIGQGFCGSVWSAPVWFTPVAMKREDGGPGRSLENEFHVHQHLLDAEDRANCTSFNISHCYSFLRSDSPQWPQILPYLPPNSSACNALLNEKILPMPNSARKLLVDEYAPLGWGADAVQKRNDLLSDPTSEHCLIRPYLGRRQYSKSASKQCRRHAFFSLRNFPLHVDRMEELGMERSLLQGYAKAMAEALAFFHWVANIDASDVEFVLAPPRQGVPGQFDWGELGPHTVWVLDFDCCRKVSMDHDGESFINAAVKSFWRNDPFYPRPGSENVSDHMLWSYFRSVYIEQSRTYLPRKFHNIPLALVDRIEETKGLYDRGPSHA